MKILVVGGAGYIGSMVSQTLWEAGHQVTVLDLLLFGGESLLHLIGRPRFELVPGDIRDEASLQHVIPGHEAVILLAAIVGEPACNRDQENALKTNLHGARNVLSIAKRAGVARFIFSSTCSNYGISDANDFVTEESPLKPLSTYSESKVSAELDILAAKSRDFCPTVLRFSTAFGVSPRMRFDLLVSDFTLAAVREQKVVVYGEQFWRPFVHVRDIAASIEAVLAADKRRASGVFNIGSNDANLRKIELARGVQQRVAGTELEFVHRETDSRSYRVDFTKFQTRFGFRANWSVEDGIREVHAALKAGIWRNPADARHYN